MSREWELTEAQKRHDVVGNDRYALTPVARGPIYCSPWCGAHCTRKAYDRATEAATALAASLGEGWTPRVWESLGWSWSATKGESEVHPSIRGSTISGEYTVTRYSASVRAGNQFIAYAEAPQDALGFAVQDARTFQARLSEALDALTADSAP